MYRLKVQHFLIATSALALTACGGGSSGSGGPDSSVLFFGAPTAGESGNGLAFADGSLEYTDVGGETLKIKVARYLTDYETGNTTIVISDETVSFDPGEGTTDEMTITIGDLTLDFSSGSATDANGRGWDSYIARSLTASAVGVAYSYSYDGSEEEVGALDTEAFFAFGYETDPAEIAALMTEAFYSGEWTSYAGVLDEEGTLIGSEVFGSGTIDFIVDFEGSSVGGSIEGTFNGETDDDVIIFEDFDVDGTIAEADIIRNGFTSTIELACPDGSTCSSDSIIGGTFFGQDGAELSGVFAFDEYRENNETGDGVQYLGGGGFVSEEIIP